MTGITVMPTGRSQTLPLTMSGLQRMSGESENVDRFLNFFCDTVQEKDRDGIFLTDGTILEGKALHPVAMTAVNAQAALASDQKNAFLCVHRFWETPLRTGDRRYYDNCLYFFAYLALSGNYRIY